MKGIFKTVFIVTFFSVCEKFLGFLYRIYLSYTIGTEGIGLYSVAISTFALILTVCCSGTPITVSRLMTKYNAEKNLLKERKVISAGIIVTLLTTLPVCVVLFFSKGILSLIFADERCINLFLILLPSLVFTSIYSVLRGVFWGRKDFLSYSVVELLEEIMMIICGIFLIAKSTEFYQGVVFQTTAVTISFIFSFLVALIIFFIRKNKIVNPSGEVLPLIKASAPITAMRTASSLITSLVSIILPLRLVAVGYTKAETMSLFGSAIGQAIPILFIPSTLIGSFIIVLIPEISENFYKNQDTLLKHNIETSVIFTIFITSLFFPIFFVCGDEIGVLIFNNEQCGSYLTFSSFLIFLIGLSSVTTSILNSVGKENKTLIYYIISAVFMLLSIWFLPKLFGIYSLLIGFTFVYGITSVLNIYCIKKTCKLKPSFCKFTFYAFLIQIPTVILGLMLKKLILSYVGSLLTLLICLVLLLTFDILLFVGFNLIKIDEIKKLISFKRKKSH